MVEMFFHMVTRSSDKSRLDLVLVLLDVDLIRHVVFNSGRIGLTLLELCHLLVFTSKIHCLGSLRRSSIVLSIPRGLLALLNSLSLECISLLLFTKSLLLDSSQEFAFFSDLVADGSLFSLASEEHRTSVIRDLL